MANAILNTAAADVARKIRSGKDGALYNEKGKLLASFPEFKSAMNVANSKVQLLGSPQEFEVNTGYSNTINLTEIVVEDNEFITALLNYQTTGVLPIWNFQGVINGTSSKQRYIYTNVIPSGNIDLQNVTTGDVIKRAWSLFVNGKVKQQGKLVTR